MCTSTYQQYPLLSIAGWLTLDCETVHFDSLWLLAVALKAGWATKLLMTCGKLSGNNSSGGFNSEVQQLAAVWYSSLLSRRIPHAANDIPILFAVDG
jgi:hypothetical protein